jgi:hypothetical protein
MGPVVWPAYTATSIGVRSLDTGTATSSSAQITAELRTDPAFAQAIAAALVGRGRRPPDPRCIGAERADGGDPDAERQAVEASRTKAGPPAGGRRRTSDQEDPVNTITPAAIASKVDEIMASQRARFGHGAFRMELDDEQTTACSPPAWTTSGARPPRSSTRC